MLIMATSVAASHSDCHSMALSGSNMTDVRSAMYALASGVALLGCDWLWNFLRFGP